MNNQLILIEDLGYKLPKETSKQKKKFGLYKCVCGKEFEAQTACVKDNKTKSCGCLKRERFIQFNKDTKSTHNLSRHRLYTIWKNMCERCYNLSNKHYINYGGNNITIYDKWKNDFLSFYNWSLENGYQDDLTIDRINNNGNYEPNNCRWVDRQIQSRNTRRIQVNNTTGYRGVGKNGNKYVAQIGVNYKLIYLGIFNTSLEAANAYDDYIIKNNLEHTRNF